MSDADLKSPGRWTRRPVFSPSQMLTAQQLNALIEEQRERSEMLMRALHGHGIIFGYAVELFEPRRPAPNEKYSADAVPKGSTKLAISCGMALDRHGRLLRWPEGHLHYRELANEENCPGRFTLSVHYAERQVPKGGCGPCGEKPEWTEDGVVFSLTRDCEHAERSCPAPKSGQCVSWDEYVCARTGSGSGKLPPAPDLQWACDGAGGLCRIECSDTRYDAGAGIPIACVRIANLAPADCPPVWGFAEVGETCEVRPYVHRTPLLYELVRGCQDNLARVKSLGWQEWIVDAAMKQWSHDVPWGEFAAKLLDPEWMTITFDQPILVRTVHPGSIFLTAVYWEKQADYLVTRRLPAYPVATSKGPYATRFRLLVRPEWVGSELNSRSELREGGRMELTIRGQMLRDRCGNMLNSVPLFYDPQTPEQSRPGGDFTAIFSFGAFQEQPMPKPMPMPTPVEERQAPVSQYKF